MQEHQPPAPRVVAVFDSTPDTLLMLRVALEHAGCEVAAVLLRGNRRELPALEAFVREQRPGVAVFEVAPPYEEQWRLLEALKATPPLATRWVVITSTNRATVERLAATDPQIFAIIGSPYDLKDVVQAVRGALDAGPPPPR